MFAMSRAWLRQHDLLAPDLCRAPSAGAAGETVRETKAPTGDTGGQPGPQEPNSIQSTIFPWVIDLRVRRVRSRQSLQPKCA